MQRESSSIKYRSASPWASLVSVFSRTVSFTVSRAVLLLCFPFFKQKMEALCPRRWTLQMSFRGLIISPHGINPSLQVSMTVLFLRYDARSTSVSARTTVWSLRFCSVRLGNLLKRETSKRITPFHYYSLPFKDLSKTQYWVQLRCQTKSKEMEPTWGKPGTFPAASLQLSIQDLWKPLWPIVTLAKVNLRPWSSSSLLVRMIRRLYSEGVERCNN